jgi:hypothetical protein
MTEELLQQAIGLIRAGRKGEAQPLLQRLIQAEPRNVPAWLWYVETCQTQAERLKVLEACARLNPGHPQVEQALTVLQTPPPQVSPFASTPQESVADWEVPKSWGAPQQESEPVRTWDPKPYEPPKEPPPAWEYTPPPAPPPQPAPPARSYAWYEVWWEVLSYRPVEAFEGLLRDPTARAGRAYLWVAISGLLSVLVAVMFQFNAFTSMVDSPQFQQTGADPAMFRTYIWAFMLCMVPFGALASVLGLIISGAIQNLLAGMFGGTGNYAATVYLLGAISAPIAIASAVISAIPFVNCLSIGFSIYSVMLNVRALMAAHQINSIKALGVIFLPGLVLFFLACIAAAIFAPSMGEILQQLEAMCPPMY